MVHLTGSYVARLSQSTLEELALVHLNAPYAKPLPYRFESLERATNTNRPEVIVTYVPERLAAKG